MFLMAYYGMQQIFQDLLCYKLYKITFNALKSEADLLINNICI